MSGTITGRKVLTVTTVGILAATLNSSILLISLPAIFAGLGMDPLAPGNVSYLLWILMGFMVVSAVLVVTFGRLGDQYGRARMFNLGFAIFTLGSVALALNPVHGSGGAMFIIVLRVVQGIGGAMLTANSGALVTDAFPANRRAFALGVNQVAAIAGTFLGLIIGGLLSEWDWRAVFWVNVPIGVWGTWNGYRLLKDKPRDRTSRVRIDWWGNATFAVGLIAILVAITYGLQPYGGHTMGWTNPKVVTELIIGAVLLIAFCLIELRVTEPMINLRLFRNRAFSAGVVVTLLSALSRGGLQFMLIIWLQGIWLPLHGYDYADTPLWAGIYMVPATIGFLVAGPVSGAISDRIGARALAAGGLVVAAGSFIGLIALPADFNYWVFGALLALNGIGTGMTAAPNAAAVMNAVPAAARGAASGIRATAMNAGQVLSMGGFFSLMAVGLASRLPTAMHAGLVGAGVSPGAASTAAGTPPVGLLFAAFLGYNPVKSLVPNPGPGADTNTIYGREFFPHLISDPFRHGLFIAFLVSAILLLIAAGASLLRGDKFVHEDAHLQPHHETPIEGLAHEGGALSAPALLDTDLDAVSASDG